MGNLNRVLVSGQDLGGGGETFPEEGAPCTEVGMSVMWKVGLWGPGQ